MSKRYFVFLLFVLTIINCTKSLEIANKEIRIDLKPAHPDTINSWFGQWLNNNPTNDYAATEEITGYPQNYKVTNTFHIHLQSAQKFAIDLQKNEKSRQRVLDNLRCWISRDLDKPAQEWAESFARNKEERKNYIETWVQHVHDNIIKNHTTQYVDCIVSVCTIENENGEEFVVFDENNDENFANDRILTYRTERHMVGRGRIVEDFMKVVETNVQLDYYDGKVVRTADFQIFLRNSPYYGYLYSLNILVGEFKWAEKTYLIALLSDQIDKDTDSMLWIDENENRHFSGQKHVTQSMIYIPSRGFSMLGQSFRIKKIDRFGKYVTLEHLYPDAFPTTYVGMQAPVFKTITIDSCPFDLSELKGKYVLLNFWGPWCKACTRLTPELKELYKKYGGDRFEIVGIGHDSIENLQKYVRAKDLKWPQVQCKNDKVDLQYLYNVRGWPSLFLVDDKGKLVATNKNFNTFSITKILEKNLGS